MWAHARSVARIELISSPNPDGTITLRAARLGFLERLRRFLRR